MVESAREKKPPQNLKEFVEFYKFYGYDDLTIISMWASANHLETEFSNMAIQLTAKKLEEERYKLNNARMIIGGYNSYGRMHHHKEYTQEEDTLIDAWISQLALQGSLAEQTVEEIKEKVPNMLTPEMCYRSLIYYINKVIGVRFKNQEKDEENLCNDYISQIVDNFLKQKEKEEKGEEDWKWDILT